jgi:putative inorganic carbon (hco3(-)) transporter
VTAVAAPDRLRIAAGAAAATGALALGLIIGRAPELGIGLVLVLGAGLLMLIDFELVIGAWAALAFLEGTSAGNALENAVYLLVVLASVVILITRGRATRYPALLIGVGLLFAWIALSASWADDAGASRHHVEQWAIGIAVVPAVMTAASTRRGAVLVLIGFLAGAVVSAIIGLVHHHDAAGRLIGSEGNADDLAAVLAPAFFIAAGLSLVARRWYLQLVLLLSAGLVALALVATQSRGGGVAIAVGTLVAAWLLRDRPLPLVLALVALGAGIALATAVEPGALKRLTSFHDDGSGRVGLWHVARRMTADHPLTGVGIGNFQVQSPRYVLEPGELPSVLLIVERRQLAHNTYLQQLTETGIIGLAALLAVVGLCLSAGLRAGRLFDARGDPVFAEIARTVVLAIVAVLVAAVFLSIGYDKRLWVLLAIAPGLLIAARSGEPAR